MNLALIFVAWVLVGTGPQTSPATHSARHGLRGVGVLLSPSMNCVTARQRRHIEAAIAHNRAKFRLDGHARGGLAPFPFYPIGGNGNLDTFHGGFVDLDPASPGFHDYNCTPFTRDGHAGIDTEIRSFGEQSIGIPVFAAHDGTVVFAQDGWPDMNTMGGVQGNIVAIDHGGGWESSYYHLKNGSVSVLVGQIVRAGQQIGKVASSGNSFGPHLHFEVRESGVVYEPFAGACRPGPSGWVNQPPLRLDSYFDDFAVTYEDLSQHPGLPFEMPRSGQIALSDPRVWFWVKGHNLPVDSSWRVQFFRPDGTQALLWEWFFFNTELYRNYWYPFDFDVPDMHTITGTWHVRVEFNNLLMVHAPIEVRVARTPDFNRPPEPITVAFDPPGPTANDVLFCRVNTSLLLDDLDYDIVRYRYLWTVDGTVVRDVVSAGQADAIPRNTACPGAVVRCTVTPSDPLVSGPGASAVVTLPGSAVIDLNCDCALSVADIPYFVQALVSPSSFSGCSINRADVNQDMAIDGRDVAGFVDALTP